MGRRTILIIVALVIATVGAALVFLYVKGVDDRAVAQQQPQQVLTATTEIASGESVDEAVAAGKFELAAVPEATILAGALSSTDSIEGMVATSTIYPGEQIIAAKFGEPVLTPRSASRTTGLRSAWTSPTPTSWPASSTRARRSPCF